MFHLPCAGWSCGYFSCPLASPNLCRQSKVFMSHGARLNTSRASPTTNITSAMGRFTKTHLHHRRQYQPQYYRCGLEVKLAEHISQCTHHGHDPDVDNAAVDRIDAKNAENQNRWIKQWIRDFQNVDENTHQRKIEDQQHHVADVHARDEPPEELRLLSDQKRSG